MCGFIWPQYLLGICVVQDTVVLQLTKELHSQQSVQGHEEQKEQCDVVDLLTRTPNKQKHVISNIGPTVSDGTNGHPSVAERATMSRVISASNRTSDTA